MTDSDLYLELADVSYFCLKSQTDSLTVAISSQFTTDLDDNDKKKEGKTNNMTGALNLVLQNK